MTDRTDRALERLDASIASRADSIDDDSAGDADAIIASIRGLDDEVTASDVEALLRRLAAAVADSDDLSRATVRAEAVEALDGKIKAPARMVDAALDGSRTDEGPDVSDLVEPDPEPWDEPINGAELLASLARVVTRYIALPKGAATALALWTLHTYTLAAASISPLLAITSPTKRCGKTNLLSLLLRLVSRPLPASNITPAAVFRAVEAASPTLLVDEADSFMDRSDELRGVLNSGHRRDTAFVIRTVGDDHTPKRFATWGAKAVACIGSLPDTLADRAIEIRMRRKTESDDVERLRLDRVDDLEDLRRQAVRFAADHADELAAADPEVPSTLHDRAADNWRPLIAVAEAAGGSWPARARRAAKLLSGIGEEGELGIELLGDLRRIIDRRAADDEVKAFTADLIEDLHRVEESPWPERGKSGLTGRSLAHLLNPFGVSSKQLRIGSVSKKGYEFADFEDPFRRYLPPREAKHPKQSRVSGGFPRSGNRNAEASVSDEGADVSTAIAADSEDVSRVSAENGGSGAEGVSGEGDEDPDEVTL